MKKTFFRSITGKILPCIRLATTKNSEIIYCKNRIIELCSTKNFYSERIIAENIVCKEWDEILLEEEHQHGDD